MSTLKKYCLNNVQRAKLKELASRARRRMEVIGVKIRDTSPIREAEKLIGGDHEVTDKRHLKERYEHLVRELGGQIDP